MKMRFNVNKVGLGLALLATTTACSGLSGSIGLEGGADAGPVSGSAGVTIGFGKKPMPITNTFNPPLAAIGLCFRMDVIMGDGTHAKGTPVLLTGAPVVQTIPTGAVATTQSFFTWGLPGLPPTGSAGSPSREGAHRFWIAERPVTLELEGGENLTLLMVLQADDIDEAMRRTQLVRARASSVLAGQVPGPRPAWLREAAFLSWRRSRTDEVEVRIGALGSAFTQYRLDVNGHAGYADLGTITSTTLGDWVIGTTTIDAALLEVPRARHVPAVNELRAEYATDETPFTSQTCKVSMTVDGGARQQ